MIKLLAMLCVILVLLEWTGITYVESQVSQEKKWYPVSVAVHLESGERIPNMENRLIFALGEIGYPVIEGAPILLDTLVSVDRVFPLEDPPRLIVNLKIDIQVKDADRGDVFANMHGTASGGGADENEAIFSGVQRINVEKELLADMLLRCSDHYTEIEARREDLSQLYFKEAQAAKDVGNYREALKKLRMVFPGTKVFTDAQRLIQDIRMVVPKPVMAVLKFKTNSSGIADNFRELLTTVLVQNEDNIKVLERDQISEILGEQSLELDGLIDPTTACEYGRLIGAGFLLLGGLTVSGDEFEVNARLVKVKTAEIIDAFHARNYLDRQETLAREIVGEIQQTVEFGKLDEITPEEEVKIVVDMKTPRVMIMIPEEHIHRPVPDPAGETEMIRKFVGSGFRVVDQAQVKKIRETREGKAAAKGDNQSAIAIARQYGAEVIIVGEAFSENVPRPGGQLQTCGARVEARALEADTGVILAANGKEAHAKDATEIVAAKRALRTAAGLLADDMIKQILESWKRQTGSHKIEIIVRNIEYSQLISLHTFLKNQEGVIDVQRREFDEGVAIMDAESENDAQSLADALALAGFDDFSVKIESVKASTIEVSCK
jgi:TolB-like protein